MKLHFGIDLGGTKIELAVIDPKFNILFRERIFTESEKGSDHVLTQLNILYKKAVKSFDFIDHSIGIGTPGSISSNTGLLRNSTIYCQNGLRLSELIQNKIQHAVTIENDANCFTLAESLLGAGKGYPFVFGVILGTGCGGGLVYNSKLRRGPQKLSGEWGHSIIDINGARCFCGKRGCINTFISGTGLENNIKIKLNKTITAENFLNQKSYTREENAILKEFYKNFGLALSNIINILDPDVVVIGGGLSNHKFLYSTGVDEVYANIFSSDMPTTPILKNSLGDSAGVIGAAIIGINHFNETR